MNRKKKPTKFFTWNRKAEGFTLIELIVVIAILAILAGVGTVAYTGYVDSAKKAADDQLIAAINKAAASAVLEARGIDMATLPDEALTATYNPTNEPTITLSDASEPNVATAFSKYFAGNESASFKYYDYPKFEGGKFVGKKNGPRVAWEKGTIEEDGVLYYTFSYGGKTVKVRADDLNNLNASTFMTKMEISKLTGDIDSVVKAASGVLTPENIANMPEFTAWLSAKGIDQNDSAKVAQAMVLYTAEKTRGDAATIKADVINGTFANEFQTAIGKEDKTDAFVKAAMAYAMVEAFANSSAGKNAEITLSDGTMMTAPNYLKSVNDKLNGSATGTAALTEVYNMLTTLKDDTSFSRYLNNNLSTTDLTGYLSAMNAINGNINNIDMDTYLSQGMTGDYMKGLVGQFKNDTN